MIQAKIIADSISPNYIRLTTMQLIYPRFIHSEFMTHRAFSRNASSSRAIPVKKMLEMICNEPAAPIHWGANQPGMQADLELLDTYDPSIGTSPKQYAKNLWLQAAKDAASMAERMMEIGVHKQIANRILEPYQHIQVVVTATDWDNFFELRAHPDAQPEIQALARLMKSAMDAHVPQRLNYGEWHLPYITEEDYQEMINQGHSYEEMVGTLAQVSAARCCRVSYLKHDGRTATVDEDLKLCARLAGARPIHASPFEHQATPDQIAGGHWDYKFLHGNFNGWIQYRKQLEEKMN